MVGLAELMNFCPTGRMNVTLRSRKHTVSMSALMLVKGAQTLQSQKGLTLHICHHLVESGIQPYRWLTLPATPIVQGRKVSCNNEWVIQRLNLAPFWAVHPKLFSRKPHWVAKMYVKASKASFSFSFSAANLLLVSQWQRVTCLWLMSCRDGSCK